MNLLKEFDFDPTKSQEGEEGEEEEPKEEDEVVEPGSSTDKRDYGKARKFARMLKAGDVPQDIVQLYQQEALSKKSPRLFRSQLINKMFQKNAKGDYVLATQSPEFLSWKKNNDTKFQTKEAVGVPHSILLWQTFQGNEAAMQMAEQKGDIYEEDNLWYFRRSTAGRTKSTTDGLELQGGKVKLDVDTFGNFGDWMSNRDWSKFGNAIEFPEGHAPEPVLKRQKSQLAIQYEAHSSLTSSSHATEPKTQKVPWKSFEHQVGQAKGANERLQRDASRWVMKVRGGQDSELQEKIKAVLTLLTDNLASLSECQMWQEVPDSNGNEKDKVSAFLGKIAAQTEKANELLEQVKAVCKARGL